MTGHSATQIKDLTGLKKLIKLRGESPETARSDSTSSKGRVSRNQATVLVEDQE